MSLYPAAWLQEKSNPVDIIILSSVSSSCACLSKHERINSAQTWWHHLSAR